MTQSASAKNPEISAVVQRTYRGATAEGEEATRARYFRNEVYAQELVKHPAIARFDGSTAGRPWQ